MEVDSPLTVEKGYGFLSENAEFARNVTKAGLIVGLHSLVLQCQNNHIAHEGMLYSSWDQMQKQLRRLGTRFQLEQSPSGRASQLYLVPPDRLRSIRMRSCSPRNTASQSSSKRPLAEEDVV